MGKKYSAKKYLPGVILSSLILGVSAQAQSLDEEVSAELDQLYMQSQQRAAKPSVQVNVQAQQQAVQKQPTTLIQASPLTESKAEQLRRARQESELQTEQKIVEQLEASRMEDEKRRAEALFGDRFNQMNNQQAPQQQQPQSPVQQVEPAPQVVPVDSEQIRSEVHAALSDMKSEEEAKKKKQTYFSGLVGFPSYQDASNVRGNYSLGFALGMKYDSRIMFEGSFVYSNFDIKQSDGYTYGYYYYPRVTNLDQYAGLIALKAQLLQESMVKPEIGAALSYTYREYKDKQLVIYNNDGSSQAFDLGLAAGFALELAEDFEMAFEYRYMWNLSYQSKTGFDRQLWYSIYQNYNPIEKLSYNVLGLSLRMVF